MNRFWPLNVAEPRVATSRSADIDHGFYAFPIWLGAGIFWLKIQTAETEYSYSTLLLYYQQPFIRNFSNAAAPRGHDHASAWLRSFGIYANR